MGRGKEAPDSENEGGHQVMAKMSFEEWKLRREYDEYLKSQDEPSEAPAAEPEKQAEPQPAPDAAPSPMGPAEDYRAELTRSKSR